MDSNTYNPQDQLDFLRSVEDAHNARVSAQPPEGPPVVELSNQEVSADATVLVETVEGLRNGLNSVVQYLKTVHDAEAGVTMTAPMDDGGLSDAITGLNEQAQTKPNITGADGIYVINGPTGVHIGLEKQEEPPRIVPFDPVHTFYPPMLLDLANSADVTASYTMRNSCSSADEQMLLLKLKKPTKLTHLRMAWWRMQAKLGFTLPTASNVAVVGAYNLNVYAVTADFNHMSASWHTHASAGPAIGTLIIGANGYPNVLEDSMGPPYLGHPSHDMVYRVLTHQESPPFFGGLGTEQFTAGETPIVSATSPETVYGIELRRMYATANFAGTTSGSYYIWDTLDTGGALWINK